MEVLDGLILGNVIHDALVENISRVALEHRILGHARKRCWWYIRSG
jgi:hypothetical protein